MVWPPFQHLAPKSKYNLGRETWKKKNYTQRQPASLWGDAELKCWLHPDGIISSCILHFSWMGHGPWGRVYWDEPFLLTSRVCGLAHHWLFLPLRPEETILAVCTVILLMLWAAFLWPFVIYRNSPACFLLREAWNEGESVSTGWLWYQKPNIRLLSFRYIFKVRGLLASLLLISMILRGLWGDHFFPLTKAHHLLKPHHHI